MLALQGVKVYVKEDTGCSREQDDENEKIELLKKEEDEVKKRQIILSINANWKRRKKQGNEWENCMAELAERTEIVTCWGHELLNEWYFMTT